MVEKKLTEKYPTMADIKKGHKKSAPILSRRRSWILLPNVTVVEHGYPGNFRKFLIDEGDKDLFELLDSAQPQPGDNEVALEFARGNLKLFIGLTSLTAKELQVFENLVARAISRARPIVEAKDAVAKELYDRHGYDSDLRIYRDVPKLYVRKGAESEYDKGVLVRSRGDAEGSWVD